MQTGHRRESNTDQISRGEKVKSASTLRRIIHKIQKKYVKFVLFLLCLFMALEFALLILYVYVEEFVIPWDQSTGSASRITWNNWPQGTDFFTAQAILCWVFSIEWAVNLVSEQYKVSFLFSTPTFINLLTCFPMCIISIGAIFDSSWTAVWVPFYLRVWPLHHHFVLLLDYPQLGFFSELTRETLRHVLYLVATMITCVGTFQAIESFSGENVIHLFESTYFIVVTFGTIGYGDLKPTTATSRFITMGIIVVAVYQFPLFFGKLAELAKERPKFTTFSSRSGVEHHVIVAGSLADRDVAFFLNEFFSGTRKFIRLKMVLLSSVEFSQETRLLVTSPGYSQRVTLVIGDAASRTDLDRCDASFADAIFHVNNTNLPSSLADYDVVMKSIAVHQYDANLPQHVMLRRERNSKFICNVVSSIMEKERLQYTLLGLGCVLPGAIPLVVNYIRTYDPDGSVEKCRDWREQNEWGMGMEIYTFEIPESLGDAKYPFMYYCHVYSLSGICVIGIVDQDGGIQLNPSGGKIDSSVQLVAIAADKFTIDQATKALLRKPTPLTEVPGYGGAISSPLARSSSARPKSYKDLLAQSRALHAAEKDAEFNPNEPAGGKQQQQQQREAMKRQQSTGWDDDIFGPTIEETNTTSIVTGGGRAAATTNNSTAAVAKNTDKVSTSAPPPIADTVPQRVNKTDSSRDDGAAPSPVELPNWHQSSEGPCSVFSAQEARIELEGIRDHIVLVDLVSARVAPDLSPEAQHEGAHFQSTDLFNLMRPIKLHNPSCEIVLLTRQKLPDHFITLWQETGCNPIVVVTGCGLNMDELRACHLESAASAVIFSTGEGVDENGDAMTLLVSFTIDEILKEAGHSIPVVISVDHIESLALFPPYYSDDTWTAEAEGNFALEPNMILGRAICSSMLDPALYQTYFSPHLLNAVDALIYGNGRSAPIKAMPVPSEGCELYCDVTAHCLAKGIVPIGLHRKIDDVNNEELDGQRFMFSNPPPKVPVQASDVIYYIGPQDEDDEEADDYV